MNSGISHNLGKTSKNKEIVQSFSKCQLAPPCPRITLREKALRVKYLNIARQRSAPGWKTVFREPGRLENHDFHDFSDFHQNAQPGWSPTRNWEILQRNRNETGVDSNDRSFNASSGKNSPSQNEFKNFSQSSKNDPSPHKKVN